MICPSRRVTLEGSARRDTTTGSCPGAGVEVGAGVAEGTGVGVGSSSSTTVKRPSERRVLTRDARCCAVMSVSPNSSGLRRPEAAPYRSISATDRRELDQRTSAVTSTPSTPLSKVARASNWVSRPTPTVRSGGQISSFTTRATEMRAGTRVRNSVMGSMA